MEIYLLGTNHKIAEVEFREKIAFTSELLPSALKTLNSVNGIHECMILSTCNRTEVYVVSSDTPDLYDEIENFLERHSGISLKENKHFFYRIMGEKVIDHLFQVASGLDSMILGETQVFGQVKDAFKVASEQGTTGALLNRLINNITFVGKRTRNETGLCDGAVSVAFAAVKLSQKIFKDLSAKSALLIGAGETGELIASHLRNKGIGKLLIANRTFKKAIELAKNLNGEALDFQRIQEVFHDVDIIVGAATTNDYLINRSDIEKIVQKRKTHSLFMIDIGVPRNFDPEINKLETVFLHNINDLEQIITRNLEKRRQEIPKVEKIISEEIQNFLEWKQTLQVGPTIALLRKKFEIIRQSEVEKHRNRIDKSELEKLDSISKSILNKLLHIPTVQLKKYGNGYSDVLLRIDVAREIFGLEDKE